MVVKHGMCGNGIRCLAKYIFEEGLTNKQQFFIETLSGNKEIELIVENKTVIGIKVDMGEVSADREELEIDLDNKTTIKGHKIFTRKSTFCMF